ncbi:hypothetical protein WMY93_010110 [Mugilogobius chulae]|uniref:Uncharacterized protein n=1 Tax=Mugilogobius chulae TaxID=88201 RepID=A0AAW0PC55_9GOBI
MPYDHKPPPPETTTHPEGKLRSAQPLHLLLRGGRPREAPLAPLQVEPSLANHLFLLAQKLFITCQTYARTSVSSVCPPRKPAAAEKPRRFRSVKEWSSTARRAISALAPPFRSSLYLRAHTQHDSSQQRRAELSSHALIKQNFSVTVERKMFELTQRSRRWGITLGSSSPPQTHIWLAPGQQQQPNPVRQFHRFQQLGWEKWKHLQACSGERERKREREDEAA